MGEENDGMEIEVKFKEKNQNVETYEMVIPKEKYQYQKDLVYAHIQKTYNKEGFRVGKVPISIIKADKNTNHEEVDKTTHEYFLDNYFLPSNVVQIKEKPNLGYELKVLSVSDLEEYIYEYQLYLYPEVIFKSQSDIEFKVPELLTMEYIKEESYNNFIEYFKKILYNVKEIGKGELIDNESTLIIKDKSKNKSINVDLSEPIGPTDDKLQQTIKDIFSKGTLNRKVGDSINFSNSETVLVIDKAYKKTYYTNELTDDIIKKNLRDYDGKQIETITQLKDFIYQNCDDKFVKFCNNNVLYNTVLGQYLTAQEVMLDQQNETLDYVRRVYGLSDKDVQENFISDMKIHKFIEQFDMFPKDVPIKILEYSDFLYMLNCFYNPFTFTRSKSSFNTELEKTIMLSKSTESEKSEQAKQTIQHIMFEITKYYTLEEFVKNVKTVPLESVKEV